MKQHPVLFNTAMVKAIKEGRKIQTRRLVKPQPQWLEAGDGLPAGWHWAHPTAGKVNSKYFGCHITTSNKTDIKAMKRMIAAACPYGGPGNILWVRETWREGGDAHRPSIYFKADEDYHQGAGWKPSIHMPRWAARIFLEITRIRVERLQSISKKDALAEGVVKINKQYLMDPDCMKTPVKYSNGSFIHDENYWGNDNPVGAFATYWEKVNGTDAWDANPWVWVIDFNKKQTISMNELQ